MHISQFTFGTFKILTIKFQVGKRSMQLSPHNVCKKPHIFLTRFVSSLFSVRSQLLTAAPAASPTKTRQPIGQRPAEVGWSPAAHSTLGLDY